jgi:hypothetical protein
VGWGRRGIEPAVQQPVQEVLVGDWRRGLKRPKRSMHVDP